MTPLDHQVEGHLREGVLTAGVVVLPLTHRDPYHVPLTVTHEHTGVPLAGLVGHPQLRTCVQQNLCDRY